MLGVGIAGPGWAAGEHIKAFHANPNTEVRAIYGRNEERTRRKMQECGVFCDYVDDYDALLARPDIDLISICVPHHLHADFAVKAAEAGKHMVLEKPIATTLKDLRRMHSAINAAGVHTITCFELRWNPWYKMVDNLILDDAIGTIFYGEVDYLHGIGPGYSQYAWNVKKDIGGSSLLTAGCHALDALVSLIGSDVVEVSAYSAFGRGEDFAEYEYDPTQVTILKFAGGAVGKVTSSVECLMPYMFPATFMGTKGTIRDNRLWSKKMAGQTGWAVIPTIMPDSGDVSHHPYQEELDYFVECILTKKPNMLDIAESVKIHEIIFAADLSAEMSRPVKLPLA